MKKDEKIHLIKGIRKSIIEVCDGMMCDNIKEYDKVAVLGQIKARIDFLIRKIETP